MAVTVQKVRDIAPEFQYVSNFPDPEIQAAIDTATTQVSPEAFGNTTDLAITYLAAHFLAVSHPEASQSQKIRAWEAGSGASDIGFLGTTRFGAIYLQLRSSQLGTRMPVVMPGGNFP